jgi:hypothetical protein
VRAQGPAFGAGVAAVVVGGGGLFELGVGAGEQGLGGLQRQGLIAFEDQDVVGVRGVGDQPGGLLRDMQGVQGQHHPGHVERGEQVADHGGLAAFVGDLALSQDHTGAVRDRRDQEHPAGGGASAAQRLAVHGHTGQQPSRRPVFGGAHHGAPLFAFGRPGCAGQQRGGGRATHDVHRVAAGRQVQGVGVQIGQDPPEGALAGHREPVQ